LIECGVRATDTGCNRTVFVTDGGEFLRTRDFSAGHEGITWEPEFHAEITDPEGLAADIVAAVTHALCDRLPAPVVVNYGGDTDFLSATSATRYLTVARAKTSTSLSLSKATITYGHENAEKLTVSVSHLSSSYATGKVTIKAGSTTICTISLSKGTGSCTLSTTKLRAGTYHLSASYGSDTNYASSNSSGKTLKVAA
jgi:hypothetical protein